MTAAPSILEAADAFFTLDEVVDKEREAFGRRLGAFERHWLLMNERVPERVRRNLELARRHPGLVGMPEQSFAGSVLGISSTPTASFNARNTSASELNVISDTINGTTPQAMLNQYCAIPPNDIFAGKMYELRAGGLYSNTATPTILFTPRWGSSPTVATNVSLGAQPAAFTTITGTTGLAWFAELTNTIRTAPPGATAGTCKAFGFVILGVPSGTVYPALAIGGAAATIDTSGQGAAGCGMTLNVTWGTSSASNTLTTDAFKVRSL